jgi:hypothetical protein
LRRRSSLVELTHVPESRAEQRAILDRASRSTLLITIDASSPVMDATFISMVFSADFQVRVFVTAPSVAKASSTLGASMAERMRHVWVRPLHHRPNSILRLLNRLLIEHGAGITLSDITDANQEALRADLRVAAERLATIARAGSIRRAAEIDGNSRSAMNHWLTRLGLAWPIFNFTPARAE